MTLPPSIRPYWSNLTSEKAIAPEHQAWEWTADPFAAKKEVEERQKRRKEKGAVREADRNGVDGRGTPIVPRGNGVGHGGRSWEGAPEVRMAPGLREMVEGTVRKVSSHVMAREADEVDDATLPIGCARSHSRDFGDSFGSSLWHCDTLSRP